MAHAKSKHYIEHRRSPKGPEPEENKCYSHLQQRSKGKGKNYRPVSLACLCCKIQEHVNTVSELKHLE